LQAVRLAGVPGQRLSFDTIDLGGQPFVIDVSCTFADVFCASLAFLWITGAGLSSNARRVAGFALGLFVLDQARIAATYALFRTGLPWRAADLTLGALAYLAVWSWLACGIRSRSKGS
jgi:hypothetical protein